MPRPITIYPGFGLLCAVLFLSVCRLTAGVPLTAEQTQDAIRYGEKFKSKDDYLKHGMKGVRVKLASAMALDGISKYATFYSDWDSIAAYAADAKREMHPAKLEDIVSTGLLHVFVEVHGRGMIPTSKLNRRYLNGHAHLVLKVGDKTIQPVDKKLLNQNDQSATSVVVESLLLGTPSQKDTLEFAFDVAPAELEQPVEVILIDGDGHQHKATATLSNLTPTKR